MDQLDVDDISSTIPVPHSPMSIESTKVEESTGANDRLISPPPSSRNSLESLSTPSRLPEPPDNPLRKGRRLPATPSSRASGDRPRSTSAAPDTIPEKSLVSLSSLSDFGGSEDSHAERRFLRHYEELESHCTGTIYGKLIAEFRNFPRFYHAMVSEKSQLWPM